MTRAELARRIVATKWTKQLTWEGIASAVGRPEGSATSALLGQDALTPAEAAAAGLVLGLTAEEIRLLQRAN